MIELVESLQDILNMFEIIHLTASMELQELVDCICQERSIGPVTIVIRDVHVGTAWRRPQFIIIPLWILSCNIYFVYWYVIHELAHIVNWQRDSHGQTFKETEQEMLYSWGMVPEYNNEFPKVMRSIGGNVLFDLSNRQSKPKEDFRGTSITSFMKPNAPRILVHPKFINFEKQLPHYLNYLHEKEGLAQAQFEQLLSKGMSRSKDRMPK